MGATVTLSTWGLCPAVRLPQQGLCGGIGVGFWNQHTRIPTPIPALSSLLDNLHEIGPLPGLGWVGLGMWQLPHERQTQLGDKHSLCNDICSSECQEGKGAEIKEDCLEGPYSETLDRLILCLEHREQCYRPGDSDRVGTFW